MDVRHRLEDHKGAFYIEIDGIEKAIMTYSKAGTQKIIIDHTEVSDELKGEGVGHKLIKAGIDYLRENNMKAIPLCPFVKSVFDKKGDEFDDVRA